MLSAHKSPKRGLHSSLWLPCYLNVGPSSTVNSLHDKHQHVCHVAPVLGFAPAVDLGELETLVHSKGSDTRTARYLHRFFHLIDT